MSVDANFRIHLNKKKLVSELISDIDFCGTKGGNYFQLLLLPGMASGDVGMVQGNKPGQALTPAEFYIHPAHQNPDAYLIEFTGNSRFQRLELAGLVYQTFLNGERTSGNVFVNKANFKYEDLLVLAGVIFPLKSKQVGASLGRKNLSYNHKFLTKKITWPPEMITAEQFTSDMESLFGDKASKLLLKEILS